MKAASGTRPRSIWLSVIVSAAAIALSAPPASALDILGFTTPGDAACWTDPACSIPRGGDSDVMTVRNPDGAILAEIFAFGNEEGNNVYYFAPSIVPPDPSQFGLYTTLLEFGDGAWSDTFGVARFYGDVPGQETGMTWDSLDPSVPGFFAVAFMSDPQDTIPPPLPDLTFTEEPGSPNPVPEPGSLDSAYLTIPYDATRYLSLEWQELGYTADFRTDCCSVPAPATLLLLGSGLAGLSALAWRRRR